MKFLIVELSPLPILIPLGPKYSPQDLFSNSLSLDSSLNVRDHVSQQFMDAVLLYLEYSDMVYILG